MAKPTWSNQKCVHAGVRFDVIEVGYPRRDGGEQRREVVAPADSVAIVPMLDAEHVVLIRNERFAVGRTLWEIPAGTLEEGEDPEVCAPRELVAETGYAARRIERLTSFYTSPGFCTERMTLYLATGLTFQGQNLDETERIVAERVSWSEAMAMVSDGRIDDAKTIAGLLFYAQFVRGRG